MSDGCALSGAPVPSTSLVTPWTPPEDLESLLAEIAAEAGGTVYRDYSGRGMFGATCVGIEGDHLAAVLEAAGARGLRGACHDQLGKGWIVYWPHLQLPAE